MRRQIVEAIALAISCSVDDAEAALDAALTVLADKDEAWRLAGQVDVGGKGWFAPPEITKGLVDALRPKHVQTPGVPM